MTALVDSEIRELCEGKDKPLIEPFSSKSLEGASYDMRLGAQWAKSGAINFLSQEFPSLTVGPGQFVLLTSLERLAMPVNLIGHNGITSSWAKRGLVSLFSPQIDPGFAGILIVPVFNAGDAPISMNLGDKIFTIEFIRSRRAASYAWVDRHGPQERIPPVQTPMTTQPNLSNLLQAIPRLVAVEDELRSTSMRIDDGRTELASFKAEIAEWRLQQTRHRELSALARATLVITAIGTLLAAALGVWNAAQLGWPGQPSFQSTQAGAAAVPAKKK